MSKGVCDRCWGSGDAHHKWANLRLLEAKRRHWEKQQCQAWLATELGCNIKSICKRIADLAELANQQARRRKIPAGEDPFFWAREWEALAKILQRLSE
jgi:hypothetical protein